MAEGGGGEGGVKGEEGRMQRIPNTEPETTRDRDDRNDETDETDPQTPDQTELFYNQVSQPGTEPEIREWTERQEGRKPGAYSSPPSQPSHIAPRPSQTP